MTRRNVLMFTEYFHPRRGGIESHVLTLAQQLQQCGIRVTIATTYPGDEYVDGVRVVRLPTPLVPGLQTIFSTHAAAPFLEVLHGEQFDLIHCHVSVFSPATVAAAYLAFGVGLPVAVTFHSILGEYRWAFAMLDRVVAWSRRPFAFSVVSESVSTDFRKLLSDRRVNIVPAAFDLEQWPAAPRVREQGVFRIVSTMRLVSRKRPVRLIEIVARAREQIRDQSDLRVYIFGDGPLRSRVESAICRYGLEGIVTLCGTRTPEEIRSAYATADAFVLSSVEESFGLAALEARSSGLPVIVRRQSGAAQFITDRHDGVLGDDDTSLSDAIARLACDSALLQQMFAHCERSPRSFSAAETVGAHLRLYDEAVERCAELRLMVARS